MSAGVGISSEHIRRERSARLRNVGRLDSTWNMASNDDACSDEVWMARYQMHHARAFDVLFARYGTRIHAFFLRSFATRDVADDLLQTTFLKVHKARAQYDAALPFRPWLYAIASRVRIDELRRRYRSKRNGEVPLDELPADDEPRSESPDSTDTLRHALRALNESQRLLVYLHRFEELSFAEIAAVLSDVEGRPVKEGTARVRAFRAYEALRAQLAGPDGGGADESKT